MRTLTVRPIYVVIFLGVLIAASLQLAPKLFLGGFALYAERLSPAEAILVGDMQLCQEVQAKISQNAHSIDQFNGMIAILNWPWIEFDHQIGKRAWIRQLLILIRNEDSPTPGGSYIASTCLLDTLGLYKEYLDKTVLAMLTSKLVETSPNGELKSQLPPIIQVQCRNQPVCAKSIKDAILNTNDKNYAHSFVYYLPLIGEAGFRAMFEIFDGIDPKELEKADSNETKLATLISARFTSIEPSLQPFINLEIDKRVADSGYPPKKIEILNQFDPGRSRQTYQTKTIAQIISNGTELVGRYRKNIPDSVIELKNWTSSFQNLYSQNPAPLEKAQLSQIAMELLFWSIQHLGPESESVQNLIRAIESKKELLGPIPRVAELLKDASTQNIGMRLLLMETSRGYVTEGKFLEVVRGIPDGQRLKVILTILNQTNNSVPGSLWFELGELLSVKEFQSYAGYINGQRRDDYILSWRKNTNRYRDANKLADFYSRGFMLTRDLKIGATLSKLWCMNVECSEERFNQMRLLLVLEGEKAPDTNLIDHHLKCLAEDSSARHAKLFLFTLPPPYTHDWLKSRISKTKLLNEFQRKRILENLQTEMPAATEVQPQNESVYDN